MPDLEKPIGRDAAAGPSAQVRLTRDDRPAEAPRLALPPSFGVLRGPLGGAVLRPWFDALALHLVTQWYLPLSRAWAAAGVAAGSIEHFADELAISVPRRPWLRRALAEMVRRRADYDVAAGAWEDALFGAAEPEPRALVRAEVARHGAAHHLMSARSLFLPLRRRLPAVKWEIAAPDEVAARHGARRDGVAFPAPGSCAVEMSREVPATGGGQAWLRFPSPCPAMADTAWARVIRPAGAADPPTVIFLHGISMESEMWRGAADAAAVYAGEGVRLVQPDAPWHARRVPAGRYGGEPAFALGPLGLIALFEAWVAEVGALVAWARRTGKGRVAVGGVSLGALASQLVATAARDWPEEMRPDALFLVTTTGDMVACTFDGSLAAAIGAVPQIRRHGWTRERLAEWRGLLEPVGRPVMAPENIVMVLGTADTVTPYPGGRMLADGWGVPRPNLFVSGKGHFSASLSLYRDKTPLRRLVERLRRA